MSYLPDQLYVSAKEKYRNGDKEGCYADLDAALSLEPNEIYYLKEKAQLKYFDEAYEDAIEVNTHLIKVLMKMLINAHANLSVLYGNLGKKDLLLQELSWLLEHHPTSQNYIYRAHLFHENGNYEEALSDYNEAIRLDADNFMAYLKRAHTNFELVNYQLVIDDMNYLIHQDPNRVPVERANLHYWIGKAHYMLGEKEKALTDFNMARQLRNEPDFQDADIAFQKMRE